MKAVEFWRANGDYRFLSLSPVFEDWKTKSPAWKATAFDSVGPEDSRRVVTGVHTTRTPAEAVCLALIDVVANGKRAVAALPPRKRQGAA